MAHSLKGSSRPAAAVLLEALPDPDTVGESEYRALYGLVQDIVDARGDLSDEDLLGLVESSMEAVKDAADAILGHLLAVAGQMRARRR